MLLCCAAVQTAAAVRKRKKKIRKKKRRKKIQVIQVHLVAKTARMIRKKISNKMQIKKSEYNHQ